MNLLENLCFSSPGGPQDSLTLPSSPPSGAGRPRRQEPVQEELCRPALGDTPENILLQRGWVQVWRRLTSSFHLYPSPHTRETEGRHATPALEADGATEELAQRQLLQSPVAPGGKGNGHLVPACGPSPSLPGDCRWHSPPSPPSLISQHLLSIPKVLQPRPQPLIFPSLHCEDLLTHKVPERRYREMLQLCQTDRAGAR